MQTLNYIDFLILGIFGISTLLGLMRGFLREVLSLTTWVTASLVSSMFSSKLAATFGGSSSTPDHSMLSSSGSDTAVNIASQSASLASVGMSFLFLFFATLVVGSLLTKLLSAATESGGISLANRFLGAIFGCLRAFLMVTIFIFLIQLTPAAENPVWKSAATVPPFQPLVKAIDEFVQPNIAALKSKAQGLSTSVTEQIKNVGSTLGGGS
ncbi:MAG: CvpA family protein [Gammaproteobacteria bacterium]|nr:CvpA family protein [Gammaproteobacteria bacterium]